MATFGFSFVVLFEGGRTFNRPHADRPSKHQRS
jgi:hypothetical protein